MNQDSKKTGNRFTFRQLLDAIEAVIIIAASYITLFLKPLRDRWGLSKKESDRVLPGDEIVPNPRSIFTHGIEIDAPAHFVWPWVAQMGKGRGGFYSYELLENMIGLGIYNSDSILQEYQDPKIGDMVPFGPDTGYPLVICDPGRAMVIENCDDLDRKKTYDPDNGHPENFLHLSWLWFVEPLSPQKSRFISRNRVNYSPNFMNRTMFGMFTEPIVFAMDRKMCLGIKTRSERLFKKQMEKEAIPSDMPQDLLS